MPNFNQIEKSEILKLIQELNFYTHLQNVLINIKQEKNWGLIIVGKLTYVSKKIVQEGLSENYKLQLAIRDIRYQSDTQDQVQVLLSLLQSLLKVIQINSRHSRDLKKLESNSSQPKLSILAPSFIKSIPDSLTTIQQENHPEELNFAIQQQNYPISPPATPPSDHILLNQQQPLLSDSSSNRDISEYKESNNSDWEDENSYEANPDSDLSLYEGGEPDPNQNFTHIDQNIRINKQEYLIKENLINVSDSQINQKSTINQQLDIKQQLFNNNNIVMDDEPSQIVLQQTIPHNDQYFQIYQGLLQTQNRIISFDAFEKYNELKEKVVSLRIQSSLTFLHLSIGMIFASIQEIFENGQIYQCMTAKSYKPSIMDASQLETYELAALKALLGILVKLISSDNDSILRIEHQQDSMFNRNTLLFKTLGKAAFSVQKDLNRELANRFKIHIQQKFLSFSTKISNLNQNLFAKANPNQPNTLIIFQKPRHQRRQHRGQNRKQNNRMRRKCRQQKRFKRRKRSLV